MSFFSRFYDFEKFPGIPREKFRNSQFFPFPWEKNLGGKTETLVPVPRKNFTTFYGAWKNGLKECKIMPYSSTKMLPNFIELFYLTIIAFLGQTIQESHKKANE